MANTNNHEDNIKFIDQMLEDFAGDEFEDYEETYSNPDYEGKHYSVDEDYLNNDDY